MGTITFDRRKINEAFQNKYSLPTYQREYKWTEKQFRELLTDLQNAFLENYKPEHGRKDVGKYDEYFLGTIITTDSDGGNKSIIDGQQRLTTMTLLLTYIQRQKLLGNSDVTDHDALIRRELYGEKDYNMSFDEPRVKLFNLLLDSSVENDDLTLHVESIEDLDQSSQLLYQFFLKFEEYLDAELVGVLLPYFADYVVNRVMLFDIGVPSEQDAHRVFVTMNDRGLKLGPIDLLKGYLLSSINDDEANAEAHENWVKTMNELKAISPEEDSQFIKTWLRAQHATSIRGKNRGDTPGDFEMIGDSYHRWIVDKKDDFGLNNADDFQTLISERIPKYAKTYTKVKQAECDYKDAFKHVYYNGVRNITLQTMLVLAAVAEDDVDALVNKKIKAVAAFLDAYVTSRVLDGKDNTYDNIRDPLFEIAKNIRGKSIDELRVYLGGEMDKCLKKIAELPLVDYRKIKRQELLHLLARIADYTETLCEQTNSVGFPVYVDRARSSKTFDVEHVLSADYVANMSAADGDWDFESEADYTEKRNKIGALVLLPRSRNRSLKEKAYPDKRDVYSTENILCQTLTPAFAENNPVADTAIKDEGLLFSSYDVFNSKAITERAEQYVKLAQLVWSKEQLT